jgi:diaminohydroxyphosphoribosylaminopyrimidine deaminase/5-amino-6-(5-phosphoribosylamino)uracil reductase
MQRALALARRGTGLCSPNPVVGCVILDKENNLAGEGWHEYDRRDHAEVVALRNAGGKARGGTAYVTLEPCNHTGRTGPCSEALIAAGVARVVAATEDPNPLVAGQGLERLRQSGVVVAVESGQVGSGQSEARRLNEGFAHWIRFRQPFVDMKVAMTLDGRIAPAPGQRRAGEPYWITGTEAREAVQELRWAADAVLTGVDTVLADNPLLTDRSGKARRRPLLRAVLDSALRTPVGAQLVRSAQNDLVIFSVSQDAARRKALESAGVRIEILSPEAEMPGRVPPKAVLDILGREGILTLLTETGSRLNTTFITADLVDRLTIFSSPQILGSDAVPAFQGLPAPVRLKDAELKQYGQDLCLSALLHDPWPSGS